MATIWKNVAVSMQSAIGSALPITALTNADPGVATSASHGLSDTNIVLIESSGMWQVNDKVVRVDNKTADTFELEGVDTSDFDTFSSGNAYLLTFGTSITTATTISSSGGDFDMIDITTIHVNQKLEQPGLPSAISFSMEHIWDPTDTGQIALKAAADTQAKTAFKFTFGTGGKILYFVGYVGFSGLPGGNAQDKVTTQGVITINGTPTYYAS